MTAIVRNIDGPARGMADDGAAAMAAALSALPIGDGVVHDAPFAVAGDM